MKKKLLLKEKIRRKGTQTAMAKDIGVSKHQVNAWCNKRRAVPPKHLTSIAEYLGMSVKGLKNIL